MLDKQRKRFFLPTEKWVNSQRRGKHIDAKDQADYVRELSILLDTAPSLGFKAVERRGKHKFAAIYYIYHHLEKETLSVAYTISHDGCVLSRKDNDQWLPL